MVQLFGLHRAQWAIGTPTILSEGQGMMGTMDVWAAMLGSVLYTSLTLPSSYSSSEEEHYLLKTSRSTVERYLPNAPTVLAGLSDPKHARSVVITLMASLFFARVVTLLLLTSPSSSGGIKTKTKTRIKSDTKSRREDQKIKKVGDEIDNLLLEIEEKEKEREKQGGGGTPRKRKGAGIPGKSAP